MNKGFVFEAGDGGGVEKPKRAQSPWEFSKYAVAIEEEHRQRKTTSIDHKISERLNAGNRKDRKDAEGEGMESDEEMQGEDSGSDVEDPDMIFDDGSEQEEDDVDDDEDEVYQPQGSPHKRRKRVDEDDEKDHEEHPEERLSRREKRSVGKDQDEDLEESDREHQNNRLKRRDHNKSSKQEAVQKRAKKPEKFFASADGASFNAVSFMELHLSRPLIRACEALGYKQPTPIQAACIPLALAGRDICGSAVTGSGKTAAFAFPILERLLFRPRRIAAIRVLILTPTRELAVQLHSMIEKLGQFTDIRCCLVVGGLSSKVQEASLRTHPDIVIATPGRMIDHLRNTQSVGLEDLAILVLDEADRLLELGFREEIHELVKLCPERRQTMLFSATMTDEVDELIKLSLNSPVRLSADPSTQRPSTLSEEVIRIRPGHEGDKEAIVLALCSRYFRTKTIIFSGTKVEAHRLKILFGLSGLKAAELHGNLTQAQRLDALEAFRKQQVDFLVATDVAARGLDIIGVETVINLECPKDITTYVHRVGRTARAGRQGCAITLVEEQHRSLLKAMAKRAGSKLQKRVVAGASIAEWCARIEQMEKDVVAVLCEEREEKALRKAEMEANKAQNMIDHESEIYARPKKTWFQSQKEKTMIAESSKSAKEGKEGKRKAVSVNDAEELKRKEKRKAEREKKLPRRKRRRLEAAREQAEDDEDEGDDEEDRDAIEEKAQKKAKKRGGELLVDVGYRRAKAAKAAEKARLAGKRVNQGVDRKKKQVKKSRSEEMQELFQSDARSKKQQHGKAAGKARKRKPGVSKKTFKSKARFKRRK